MDKSFESFVTTQHFGELPWLGDQELVLNINTDVLDAAVFDHFDQQHEGHTNNEKILHIVCIIIVIIIILYFNSLICVYLLLL